VNHVSHLCEEKWLVEATVVLKKTEHFSRKTFLTENYVLYTKTVFFFLLKSKKVVETVTTQGKETKCKLRIILLYNSKEISSSRKRVPEAT